MYQCLTTCKTIRSSLGAGFGHSPVPNYLFVNIDLTTLSDKYNIDPTYYPTEPQHCLNITLFSSCDFTTIIISYPSNEAVNNMMGSRAQIRPVGDFNGGRTKGLGQHGDES